MTTDVWDDSRERGRGPVGSSMSDDDADGADGGAVRARGVARGQDGCMKEGPPMARFYVHGVLMYAYLDGMVMMGGDELRSWFADVGADAARAVARQPRLGRYRRAIARARVGPEERAATRWLRQLPQLMRWQRIGAHPQGWRRRCRALSSSAPARRAPIRPGQAPQAALRWAAQRPRPLRTALWRALRASCSC